MSDNDQNSLFYSVYYPQNIKCNRIPTATGKTEMEVLRIWTILFLQQSHLN